MMRTVMSCLCLLWGVSCVRAVPRVLETTPVDIGSVECEGIREMKALADAETRLVQKTDHYSEELARAGFTPAPCTDGSRASVPLKGHWVAGCHFVYQVTSAAAFTEPPGFKAQAMGRTGAPSAIPITLQLDQSLESRTFSLEREGTRRTVGGDECLPVQSFKCAAQLREGLQGIRELFTTERAFVGEKARYSSSFKKIGFWPMGCGDATNTPGPDGSWLGGCRFIYHVDLTSSGFLATARAVSGDIQGTQLQMNEQGALTLSSLPPGCE